MKKIDKNLKELGLAPDEPGKGKNVWYCMGYVPQEEKQSQLLFMTVT